MDKEVLIKFYKIANPEGVRDFRYKKGENIAIGDDNNDLSMFEQVGYKVAMGNAINIIKGKADEITLYNDEDGVAIFLEKLLEER